MDKEPQYKIGDIVSLAAGGPPMSAFELSENAEGLQEVNCRWFDSEGVLQEYSFFGVELGLISRYEDRKYKGPVSKEEPRFNPADLIAGRPARD